MVFYRVRLETNPPYAAHFQLAFEFMSQRSSSPVPASSIVVRPLQVAELATVLSETLARLSPTRVGILSDQLRGIVRSDRPEDLIVLSAGRPGSNLEQSVIAIALLPERGDTATILHVDWAHPGRAVSSPSASLELATNSASALQAELGRRFIDHSIHFIQWATDPQGKPPIARESEPAENSIDVRWWPEAMKFTAVGTLEYLAIDAPQFDNSFSLKEDEIPTSIRLTKVAQDTEQECSAFEDLVTRTYHGSLDCPLLESYRSTHDILQSYRLVPAYSPDLWFTVHGDAADPIGCFLLARHTNSENEELVIELVYMGVATEHRGNRWGQRMMSEIMRVCKNLNAVRLVLAVDQQNHPARNAYERVGMKPLFQETVWARNGSGPAHDWEPGDRC